MACTCGWARMEQECKPWCRSKCATPFFVMDLVTMHRLGVCSRACLESMPDVLFEAANKSDTGSVLVLHVRENGQQVGTFEVYESDQNWVDECNRLVDEGRDEEWLWWRIPNGTQIAQGHAHMCV